MYDLRIQDFGMNTSVSYKINSTNQQEYRYGNKSSTSMQAYYKWRLKDVVTIAPNAGILYESAAKDMDKGLTADLSGGSIFMSTFGAEMTYKNIAVGANVQVPATQQLAGGFVKANTRAMIHLSFML
jgi:hypothetical protein